MKKILLSLTLIFISVFSFSQNRIRYERLINKHSIATITTIPTSSNTTVQNWLNKIGTNGYTYPTQSKVDKYTLAFTYADANGLTTLFDLIGVFQTNDSISRIPFIHSGGSSRKFSYVNKNDFILDVNKGYTADVLGLGTGYINTNYNVSTDKINATQNNTCYGFFVNNRVSITQGSGIIALGVQKTTVTSNRTFISLNNVTFSTRLNNVANTFAPVNDAVTENVLCSVSRTVSTSYNTYTNSILGSTANVTSSTIPNLNLWVLGANNSNSLFTSTFTNGYISFIFYASGTIDQVKLYTFVTLLLS